MGVSMSEGGQIDRRKALQWLEGDERMFDRIKAIFLKNIPPQVEQLKALLDAGDTGAAERIAHTIMGSSAMLGATVMSEEARKIEQLAIDGDMDSARFCFAAFAEEYEKVLKELVVDGGEG
jgi:HPt (histidine-containing phosphotransfer) domain-containing protein